MVQTEQQYICIHQCLLAVLEGNEVQGPPREIHHNQGFEGKLTYFFLIFMTYYFFLIFITYYCSFSTMLFNIHFVLCNYITHYITKLHTLKLIKQAVLNKIYLCMFKLLQNLVKC